MGARTGRIRRWLLARHVGLWATVLPDLLKFLPLRRALAWFTPRGTWRLYAGFAPEEIADLVSRRLRRPWRMRGRPCLRQGLLTFYFLRLAGVPARLHFGVYPFRPQKTQAHCWVTVHGASLTPPAADPHAVVLVHGG